MALLLDFGQKTLLTNKTDIIMFTVTTGGGKHICGIRNGPEC